MRAVIMAGGKGTRIASLFPDIPKPMIPIGSKPLLLHMLECLKEQGIKHFTFALGYKSEYITEFFGDGSKFGVNIDYYFEKTPKGSAGALFEMKLEDDFLLINGDLAFNMDIVPFISFHKSKEALATLAVHPNSHPFDSTLIVADSQGRVTGLNEKGSDRYSFRNCVNSGVHILSPKILENLGKPDYANLDRDIIFPAIRTGKVYAYETADYIKDAGTPERYFAVCKDFESLRADRRQKRKAVFLDRDGTLNRYKGYITQAQEIELTDGAAKAVKMINDAGYLAVVVSNQPQVARGLCSIEDVGYINGRMEALLAEEGAYLDSILFCPHHPDSGFEGERKEYKINCSCRKPKPGLIFEAAEKYNIDLSESYVVGDSVRDIEAGISAGCMTAFIERESGERSPDGCEKFGSLYDFALKYFK